MSTVLQENTAINSKSQLVEDGLTIRFSKEFNDAKYQLFEVPDKELLDQILSQKEKPIIKSYENTSSTDTSQKSTVALNSSSQTFKIKKAENTNQLYILDVDAKEDKGAEILHQTTQHIELSQTNTKTWQVIDCLQRSEKLSREQIQKICQISEQELSKILDKKNYQDLLRILEVEENQYTIQNQSEFFDVLDDLLVLLNSQSFQEYFEKFGPNLSVAQIQSFNDGVIKSEYNERHIEFALKHLCQGNDAPFGNKETVYTLKREQVQKMLQVKLLLAKSDGYRVKEFVKVLKELYQFCIPQILGDESNDADFDPKKNIYENFTELDLQQLGG